MDTEILGWLYNQKSDQIVYIYKNKICSLGRNRNDSALEMTDPAVSSIHCVIWAVQFEETSVPLVYIKDRSMNGTYVNKRKLGKDRVALLNQFDKVWIPHGVELEFASKIPIPKNPYRHCAFQNWKITDRVIGSGTFGCLYTAKRIVESDFTDYAVKVIKLGRGKVPVEAEILKKLDNPHVVKIYDTVEREGSLYIFEELVCGGDLFSYLVKQDGLAPVKESEALFIVYQILLAIRYLHSQGIVHRDLKLDNILLSSPEPYNRVIVADFGISKSLASRSSRMHTVIGTPEYAAPEVGFTTPGMSPGYTSKCDIWSVGVITHILLTGVSPFYGNGSHLDIVQNVKCGRVDFCQPHWQTVTPKARSFVAYLLETNVAKRPSIDDCFKHQWIDTHKPELEALYHKKVESELTQ